MVVEGVILIAVSPIARHKLQCARLPTADLESNLTTFWALRRHLGSQMARRESGCRLSAISAAERDQRTTSARVLRASAQVPSSRHTLVPNENSVVGLTEPLTPFWIHQRSVTSSDERVCSVPIRASVGLVKSAWRGPGSPSAPSGGRQFKTRQVKSSTADAQSARRQRSPARWSLRHHTLGLRRYPLPATTSVLQ